MREIPKELFEEGYRFVSIDIELLYMSIPLSRIINIILDRIYNQKLLKANIKKQTLQKLLKRCCTKNVFTFNNVIYEQIDGVSMWSCLGPAIANFIMTELEIKVVDSLFRDGLWKF